MLSRFLTAAIVATGVGVTASGPAPTGDLASTLSRIGAYVQGYYSHAQRVVTDEQVVLQPLDPNLSFDGFPRRVENELRVEWDPAAPDPTDRARVVRDLVKATGPALFAHGEEDCADPQTLTPEPLSFLLPDNQAQWVFTGGKPTRADGRAVVTIDYVQREPHAVTVTGSKNCVFVDLSGHTKGRLWADAATGEVVRIDEWLAGPVDIRVPREFQKKVAPRIQYERQMTTVHYKRVTFTDPDETLLVPDEIDAMSVYSGRGVTRIRTTQRFSNYRRFVTETRMLGSSQ